MANQKISELTAIITIDNSADVLPIVDISANTTKKVTPTQLKTALALDNVNNTSDANKPVSIAQQDALNAKVSSNAAITAGTAPKITFDAKGLVTSGDSLDETDLPTGINANKIGTGVVSTTEFEYLNGVTSAIQTQIDSKQATLVSGTNIKTINSTSLLGSGDITIAGNPPSGVAGAIQFSNGSAFASDASNLFWDDTNNRLGIGTATPTSPVTVSFNDPTGSTVAANYANTSTNSSGAYNGIQISAQNGAVIGDLTVVPTGGSVLSGGGLVFRTQTNHAISFNTNDIARVRLTNAGLFGINTAAPTAQLQVVGSGSTSATTSLLVQNSGGTAALTIKDDLSTTFGSSINANYINMQFTGIYNSEYFSLASGVGSLGSSGLYVGSGGILPSAIIQANSTTKGFLPPVMTTTQKNAIATPASGLVVYDSTTNKLCCYNGSTWNDLF